MGKQALKFLLRPLSAFSLVVPMFGMLGAVAVAAVAAAPALADGCPDEEFRQGRSAKLPDCRAYESPIAYGQGQDLEVMSGVRVSRLGTDVMGIVWSPGGSRSKHGQAFERGAQRPAGVVGLADLHDSDVRASGDIDEGLDVLWIPGEDRDGRGETQVLGYGDDQRVDGRDLLALALFDFGSQGSGALCERDARQRQIDAALRLDKGVDEPVDPGLLCEDLRC